MQFANGAPENRRRRRYAHRGQGHFLDAADLDAEGEPGRIDGELVLLVGEQTGHQGEARLPLLVAVVTAAARAGACRALVTKRHAQAGTTQVM